ncbi:MAG: DUF1543 domain-containing protein [Acinetobacter sp.]
MDSQLQLFIVLLGGKHPQANIEVHDLIPIVATTLSDQYSMLKQRWFGQSLGLHIDGWMTIRGAMYQGQSYAVQIESTPSLPNSLKLYLINLGGYIPQEFGEAHRYVVVAGKNPQEAKQQGKQYAAQHWQKAHTDAVIDVDDCLLLDLIDHYHIHLVAQTYAPNEFQNDYIII